jgi:Kef-type K+ transport system membrane component KefB/predicted amino acid-binding ACT domain protein
VDVNAVLFDILVVLVAAKLAAEVASRIGIPAVVGEIVAGALIGPSLLDIVEPNDVLATLAELGVILLLLDVGMELDVGDLRSVGRAALGVAVVGVVVPFAAGFGVGSALGLGGSEAVFVGAALTATSVGITARVFGDLRALGTVEARTVLGAAVADDVLGLIVLTVVVRVVTEGSVSAGSIAGLALLAIGFLAVAIAGGLRVAPPLFRAVGRRSRSHGTLIAIALAFTLAIAELAHAVQLAPIVGAFVAGLALARTHQADRIRRELAPIGHLFIPVFFLHIGIDADLAQFTKPSALGLAAALLGVAVVGKLVAAAGMWGAPGDRLLVGIGMIPRGEVGLIFATLGLREGIFGADVYAALVMVVLVTSLGTPPLLRWRLRRIDQRSAGVAGTDVVRAVAAAGRIATGAGSSDDLDTLRAPEPGVRALTDEERAALVEVVQHGSAAWWRALWAHGVLHRVLPELAEAIDVIPIDDVVDPDARFSWSRSARLRESGRDGEVLCVAAIALDVARAADAALALASAMATRLGLDDAGVAAATAAVRDADLLPATARRTDGLDEGPVVALAAHFGSFDHVARAAALGDNPDLEPWVAHRVGQLVGMLAEVFDGSGAATDLAPSIDERRDAVRDLLGTELDAETEHVVAGLPRAYLAHTAVDDVARQVRRGLAFRGRDIEVHIDSVDDVDAPFRVEFVANDRVGLLAREARLLAEFGADIRAADVVTWASGRALASFSVDCPVPLDVAQLRRRLRELLVLPLLAPPCDHLRLEWDDFGSPWHTRCAVVGEDRPGALAAVTAAFAAARVSVHRAVIASSDDQIDDVFELSDRRGSKLDARAKFAVERALAAGSVRAARGSRVGVR